MPNFKSSLHSKLPSVGTSIFSVMSQLANEHQAINLSQGFPDFDCSPELIKLINDAFKAGHNQYAPMPGLLSLRLAISKKTNDLHGKTYDPATEITITAGATQAIFTVISTFVQTGDEVIIFEPAYDCYEPAITLNGGKTIRVTLEAPGFRPDWNLVARAVNEKTKLIIINSPHNPTGTTWALEDMLALEKIVTNSNAIVLSDEVYEHLIFDGIQHQSVARFPKLIDRSFIIGSFGKTFHATGWKIGYCLAPDHLMTEFRKAHQFIVFSVNSAVQHGLALFLEDSNNYLHLNSFYQNKRDYFLSLLKESRFQFKPSTGTYFQLLKYSAISTDDDLSFAVALIKKQKIASIPVSAFYKSAKQDNLLRFCFAKKESTLEQAASILNSI